MGISGIPDAHSPEEIRRQGGSTERVSERLLLVLAAYVAGAIPTSLWVGRLFYRIDLRKEGSGNLGATNAFRILGWKAALPVVAVDTLKGWAPAALFPLFGGGGTVEWGVLYGAVSIVGHVFSFWVGFRGGKGVATSAGVLLALAPVGTVVALGVWVVIVWATGFVSLGSIAAALTLPAVLLVIPHDRGRLLLPFTALLAAFVLWTHRTNITKLLRGEEHRFGRKGTG